MIQHVAATVILGLLVWREWYEELSVASSSRWEILRPILYTLALGVVGFCIWIGR